MLVQELDRDMEATIADVSAAVATADGGTVERTIEARLADQLSFLDFWDEGDLAGDTDASTAIAAALAEAGADRTLHFPSGIFKLSAAGVDYTGCHIQGSGTWNPATGEGTRFVVDSELAEALVAAFFTSGGAGRLEDVTIDCSDKAGYGVAPDCTVEAAATGGTIIKNVSISGATGVGLYATYCKDAVIENIDVSDCSGTAFGIVLSNCPGLQARGLRAKDCYDAGLWVFSSSGTIDGVDLSDNCTGGASSVGYSLDIDTCTEGLTVTGVQTYHVTADVGAILLHDCLDVHVQGARLEEGYTGGSAALAVVLDNCKRCTGTGITILAEGSNALWHVVAAGDLGHSNLWTGSATNSGASWDGPLYEADVTSGVEYYAGQMRLSGGAPTAGAFEIGMTIWESSAAQGATAFRICTAGGEPGTWLDGPIYPVPA
jgi:hypothetical protein